MFASGTRVGLCYGSPCRSDDLRKVMGNCMFPSSIGGIFGKGLQRQDGLEWRGVFLGVAAVACVSRLGHKSLAPVARQSCYNASE